MDRREALKLLASAVALPFVSPEAFSLFRNVHAQLAEAPGLKRLTPHQDATVTAIAELIMPQTDLPGAKAVKVNGFIDLILTEWCDEADTARFLGGLSEVEARSQDRFGKEFIDCAQNQQTQLLSALDEEAFSAAVQTIPSNITNNDAVPPLNFFRMMKRLTLIGYYTSETGFVEELHRSIIPSSHAGCTPVLEELTK